MTVLHQARSSSAGASAGSIAARWPGRRRAAPRPADAQAVQRARCGRAASRARRCRTAAGSGARSAPANGRLDRPAPPGVVASTSSSASRSARTAANSSSMCSRPSGSRGHPPDGQCACQTSRCAWTSSSAACRSATGPAGPHHVLGLLAQPATQPVAHVDAALRAPLLGGRGGDEVGGGALEDDRLEHVERGAHAVEHRQLLGPRDDGRRLREPGLGGHLRGALDQRRAACRRAGARGGARRCRRRRACAGRRRTRACRSGRTRNAPSSPARHEVGGELGPARRVEHARDVRR